jgi:hypothetical protein
MRQFLASWAKWAFGAALFLASVLWHAPSFHIGTPSTIWPSGTVAQWKAVALSDPIAELTKGTLGPQADRAGFILGELTQSRVSVAESRRPPNALATFDLNYSLVHKSERDTEVRLNPELSASGNCGLSGPERTVSDLHLDARGLTHQRPRLKSMRGHSKRPRASKC